MNGIFFFSLVGVALFCLGLYALIVYPHLLRKILALNVMGSGVFLLLVSLARRTGEAQADAVPQAMVITGIVVAVSATALALKLMLLFIARTGCAQLSDKQRKSP